MKVSIIERKLKGYRKVLFPPSPDFVDWAINFAMPAMAIRDEEGTVCCIRCGNSKSDIPEDAKTMSCQCSSGMNLDIVNAWSIEYRRIPFSDFFSLIECVEDMAVIRTFKFNFQMHLHNGQVSYRYREVCQHWFDKKGESCCFGVPIFMGFLQSYGSLKIRRSNEYLYAYYADIANVYPSSDWIKLDGVINGKLDYTPSDHLYTLISTTFEKQEEISSSPMSFS